MDKEAHIREWIRKLAVLRPELGGFAVCPYASGASFTIIECLVNDIKPIDGFDIVIFVIERELEVIDVEDWCESLNTIYPEWVFLEDAAEKPSYIGKIQTNNGFYNLILMQNREKLRKAREKLGNTPYYDYWSDAFLREVLADDYELIERKG
jgi:hypothetical protein